MVLLFKMKLPEGYKVEDQTEIKLGFQMQTSSSRMNEDPFDIITPIIINVGALKPDNPAK